MAKLAIEQRRSHKQFEEKEFALIDKLLTWSDEHLLPVIDLFRVFSLEPAAAEYYSKNLSVVERVMGFLSKDDIRVQLFSCRAIINLFNHSVLIKAFASDYSVPLDSLAVCRSVTEGKLAPKVRTSFVLVMTQMAHYFRTDGKEDDVTAIKVQMLSTLNEILVEEQDKDILYRCLVCLGTLLYQDEESIGFTEMFDLPVLLQQVANRMKGDDKVSKSVKAACQEIVKLLQQ